MLAGAKAAMQFAQGRTREDLDRDDMFRRALINSVQEIGEAAARTSDAGRARAAGALPWGQIVEMRHVIVHVYWGVDLDLLWKAVAEDLPELVAVVEKVLAEWDQTPG
jgi:uncharacterized protein with HEPN domain